MIDFRQFLEFASALSINTKERGQIQLGGHWLGTQQRLFDEIQIGLVEDQHEFVVLKARQHGISTALLAWDLFFVMKYPGTPGVIVTHDDPAREDFRAKLEMMYEGLPNEWKVPIVQHNRNQLVFENRSMLQYKVAGLKETSAKVLGRSSAVSFCHCTETAFWGDPEQIYSLKSSMAEKNPMRFFIWESTANSFNHFYRMWESAKQSSTIKTIFIGWWSNETYRLARNSQLWRKFWGSKGKLSGDERQRYQRVRKEFGVELDDEQIAWYRWMAAEKIDDEIKLLQEYPTLPEDAFQASGSKYFTGQAMTEHYRRVLGERTPDGFRLHFGQEFTDTQLEDVKDARAHLRIYAEPVRGAYYVLGADPAYGSSETADRFAATVLRCYANRIEQVAEYCTVDLSPYTFAWVIVYLAGAYQPCLYNIEINGPGTAVFQEIENLRRMAGRAIRPGLKPGPDLRMRDVVRRMSEFLYAREDSMNARPQGKHTLTTERIKETYMGLMKDNFERGIFVPHSRFLLDEMQAVVRDEGRIAATSDAHDDRVIAAALAVKAWNDQLRPRMISQNIVWIPEDQRVELEPPAETVLGRSVRNYLTTVGIVPKPLNPNIAARVYNVPRR